MKQRTIRVKVLEAGTPSGLEAAYDAWIAALGTDREAEYLESKFAVSGDGTALYLTILYIS